MAVLIVGSGVPLRVSGDIQEGTESVRVTVTTRTGVRELPPEDSTRLRIIVHEERPGHRLRRFECQVTANDQAELFALAGWHLPAVEFPYVVNASKAPAAIRAQVDAALAAATATWSAADAEKQLVHAGTSTVSRPRYDGQNVVLWRALSRRTIAAAYIWYDPTSSEVLDADMVFNTRVPWAVTAGGGDCAGDPQAYDLQAVATHELGHWIGLDDLYTADAVDLTMFGIVTAGELKKATLGTGDALGARAVAP